MMLVVQERPGKEDQAAVSQHALGGACCRDVLRVTAPGTISVGSGLIQKDELLVSFRSYQRQRLIREQRQQIFV